MELGGLEVFRDSRGGFSGQSTVRKFLGSNEHLDAAEIITAQDYKHKKTNVNGSTHIQC